MSPMRKRRADDRPDVEGARERLEEAKRQRPDIDALVEALKRERQLNNFSANLIATFRGGRP